jgi:hypothetical protein
MSSSDASTTSSIDSIVSVAEALEPVIVPVAESAAGITPEQHAAVVADVAAVKQTLTEWGPLLGVLASKFKGLF